MDKTTGVKTLLKNLPGRLLHSMHPAHPMRIGSFVIIIIFTVLSCRYGARELKRIRTVNTATNTCMAWDQLYAGMRDGRIHEPEAVRAIALLHQRLRALYREKTDTAHHVFPLQGYSAGNAGVIDRSSYNPGPYDFYAGLEQAGHPAYDIFVHDTNQDSLDDRTVTPVRILAYTSGIVIALNSDWPEKGHASLKGGKYVWIFDPFDARYYYYAHLKDIRITLGDEVKAGQVIGSAGRTGRFAFQKRSPTHLHFMCLSFINGRLVPFDVLAGLEQAEEH
jgi:peptidoglycan LD-endopeptidase LytH